MSKWLSLSDFGAFSVAAIERRRQGGISPARPAAPIGAAAVPTPARARRPAAHPAHGDSPGAAGPRQRGQPHRPLAPSRARALPR